MMKISTLVFDLDGTLLNRDHQLSNANRKALHRVMNTGIEVWLASGRTTLAMRPFYEELRLNTPLISYNGATVTYSEGRVESAELPPAVISAVVALAREHRIQLNLYGDDRWYTERPQSPETRRYQEITRLTPTAIDLDEVVELGAIKALFIGPPEKLSILRHQVQSSWGTEVNLTSSMFNFLEVVPWGVNKGATLQRVTAERGISLAEVIAFGDGLNDLELLQSAGRGVAMANAHADLKEIADDHAPHHAQDGIARYLEQIGL